MTEATSVTAYSIPSGMGGSFTASIIQDLGDKVRVRLWYGNPTPKGWKSWGEWDGKERVVLKTDLSREHEMKLVRPMEEENRGFFISRPYTADDYDLANVFRKCVQFYPDSDFLYLTEHDKSGDVIKHYEVAHDSVSPDQLDQARELEHQPFSAVEVWRKTA